MDKHEREAREKEWGERYEKEEKIEKEFEDLVEDWCQQTMYETWWVDNAILDFIKYIYLDRGYKIRR